MAIDRQVPITRRGVLAAGVAGVAAALAGVASRAERAFAAGSDGEIVVVGGNYPDVRTATVFTRQQGSNIMRFEGAPGNGDQVIHTTKGVHIHASFDHAEMTLEGFDIWHSAIAGGGTNLGAKLDVDGLRIYRSPAHGDDDDTTTVKAAGIKTGSVEARSKGSSAIRGHGFGNTGKGVYGTGTRGGVFAGSKAQVRLQPGSRSNHPERGNRGDLYLDKRGRLWFCKGNRNWKQVA